MARVQSLLPLLLLLLLLCTQIDEASSRSTAFTRCPEENYDVREGSTVTLPCQVDGKAEKKKMVFNWMMRREEGSSLSWMDPSARKHYSKEGTVGDLSIRTVDRIDDKLDFSCVRTEVDKTGAVKCQALAKLHVFYLYPTVSVHRTDINGMKGEALKVGDEVELTCKFETSSKSATIRWFQNGNIFCKNAVETGCITDKDIRINNSSITIKFGMTKSGVYHCSVEANSDTVLSPEPFQLFPEEARNGIPPAVIYATNPNEVKLPFKLSGSAIFSYMKVFGFTHNNLKPQSIDSTKGEYVAANKAFTFAANSWKEMETNLNFGSESGTRHFFLIQFFYKAVRLKTISEVVKPSRGSTDRVKNFEPPLLQNKTIVLLRGSSFTQRVYLNNDRNMQWRPYPNITWKFDGNPIGNKAGSGGRWVERLGDLVLRNVQPYHSATYSLSIKNLAFSKTFSIHIDVASKPVTTKNNVTIEFEDNVPYSIRCPYKEGNVYLGPATSFSWVKFNTTDKSWRFIAASSQQMKKLHSATLDPDLSLTETNGTLVFKKLQIMHSGTYRCKVITEFYEGNYHSSWSGYLQLKVTKRLRVCPLITNSIVLLESDIQQSIKCSNGSDSIKRIWKWQPKVGGGKKLLSSLSSNTKPNHDNSTLLFDIALKSSEGVYFVEGIDKVTGKSAVVQFTVHVLSKIKFKKISQNATVIIGQEVLLDCEVSGKPVPAVKWHFTDSEGKVTWYSYASTSSIKPIVKQLMNGTLLIHTAYRLHSGVYRCIGSTKYQTVSSKPIALRVVSVKEQLPESRGSMAKTIAIVVSCAVGYLSLIVFLSICCALRMQRRKRKQPDAGQHQQLQLQNHQQQYLNHHQQQQYQYQQQQQQQQRQQNAPGSPSFSFLNGNCKNSELSCYEPTGPSFPAEYKALLSHDREYTPQGQTAELMQQQQQQHQLDCSSLNSCSGISCSFPSIYGRRHTNTPANSVIESTLERVCRIHQQMRNRLQFKPSILGHSIFGIVRTGTLNSMPVLIKELGSNDPSRRNEFGEQMKMFAKCDHDYVTRLRGICTELDEKPLIILEYCEKGNLYELLAGLSRQKKSLSQEMQLRMCLQVAEALEHFHGLGFVHGDLGCRNILVTQDWNLKLTNTGPGLDRFTGQYTQNNSNSLMPIRWLPPEAVLHNQFGIKTDVWSFGVVLTEIFTLGRMPFSRLSDTDVLLLAQQQNYRPEMPDCLMPELQALLDRCWSLAPDRRPTASQIVSHIAKLTTEQADV